MRTPRPAPSPMLTAALLTIGAALTTASPAYAQVTALDRARLPMCDVETLSLAVDSLNGSFNGMSHGGTLVVLRNIGPAACRVEQLPTIRMLGADGKALPITGSAPRVPGMHPGPVRLPVVVVPGAELTSRLTWISGPVFDHNACFDAQQLTVAIGGKLVSTAAAAHLCSAAGTSATFTQTFLEPDPVYAPPPPGAHIAPHIAP